jgi:hypothetical protein
MVEQYRTLVLPKSSNPPLSRLPLRTHTPLPPSGPLPLNGPLLRPSLLLLLQPRLQGLLKALRQISSMPTTPFELLGVRHIYVQVGFLLMTGAEPLAWNQSLADLGNNWFKDKNCIMNHSYVLSVLCRNRRKLTILALLEVKICMSPLRSIACDF